MELSAQRRSTLAQMADYGALIKGRQTALLLVTGICAYTLTKGLPFAPREGVWTTIALLLSISGCTALNMLIDRDIDSQMSRTADRPLPAKRMRPLEARLFGGLLSAVGLAAPTERRNWLLFRSASLYMLLSSLLLTIGALL